MTSRNAANRTAVIVTALPIEFDAVRQHLRDLCEQELPHGMVAEVGTLDSGDGPWSVWLLEAGMGNESAALETDRAVAHVKPEVVLFVGIAGGRKDVEIGDVVVASRVYGYEAGKDEEVLLPRPSALEPTYRILQRARAVARGSGWTTRIKAPQGTRLPKVIVKPIAAGEKVVGSHRAAVARHLDAHYGDTAAVEMEGHGFHRAMHARPGVEALVVRGISDLLDNKAASDAAGGQEVAVRNAAAFVVEILCSFVRDPAARPRAEAVPADEFWMQLAATAATLYDRGPMQDGIWERAGGHLTRIPLNQSARGAWHEAIKLLRQGAEAGMTAQSLLNVMQSDFPDADSLLELLRACSD